MLLTVRFIDRWEPEPKPLLLFAFVWGAVVSIAVTMLIQPYFSLVAGPASGLDYTTFAVTVQAPVVEEFAKSLGLLVLLLFAPKHFNGPVDGVVFAFTIAAGFAFTENILYFGRAIAESSDPGTDLAVVFFLRGVMSPFAHAIFTGTTGLIMGFAARRGHTGLFVLAFVVGLVPAMLLHSAWNSMGQDFLAAVPAGAGADLPAGGPGHRAAAGGGAPADPPAAERNTRPRAGSPPPRWTCWPPPRAAVPRCAGPSPFGRGAQMKALLDAATQLALTRQRILSGRDVPAHQRDEQHQLAEIAALRAAVVG